MRALLVLAVWLGLSAGAWFLLGPVYGSLWLGLGLASDLLCEKEAKKKGENYSGVVQVTAYVFGPAIVPVALVFALVKGLWHLVRRH